MAEVTTTFERGWANDAHAGIVAPSARRGLIACLAAVMLSFTSPFVAAQDAGPGSDDSGKAWQEAAVQLPAAPKDADLVIFPTSATARLTFAIDAKSLSVGADGVVRYTLVATSPGGARNVSYEGIRCETFERKLYAFGRDDGSWSRAHNDAWERMRRNERNRAQATLAEDYFCDVSTVAGSAKAMLDRIRYDRPVIPRTDSQ